jgi:hypothetical protein
MNRLTICAVVFLLTSTPTQGADISVLAEGTPTHLAIILIQGPFLPDGYWSDTDTFSIIATNQKHGAIVFLDGPGGNIATAIWIGLKIREHGFKTSGG